MKKILILCSAIGILISVLCYQEFALYQIQIKTDRFYQAFSFLGTPDTAGMTGFDKLVLQTINKVQKVTPEIKK